MNKPKAQTSTSENAPWAAQQPFMTDGMQSALDIYKQGQQTGPYTGAYSAGMNPTQQAGYGAAVDYARGPGAALAGQAGQNAGALMGATQPFLSNAGQLAANGAGGLNATAAGVLSGAASGQTLGQTTTAGSAGLAAQQGALATSQGLASRASGDPNAAVLAGARGYVDNDMLQGQVDAATRDVARTLGEETLPGLNARAMAGGNVNSARAGAAEAVARRGAEDRAATISATMRGDAYKAGLATSLAAQDQQNALALGANAQTATLGGALSSLGEGQRQFNGSQQMDAASSLGALSLQSQQIDANTRLQANGQLGQAALSGIDAANAAGSLSDANASRYVTAGDAYQAEQNRQLQEAQAQFYGPQEYAQQQLANYWSIVGNPVGKSETATTSAPQGMGMIQGALGGAAAGAGLYSALKPSGGALSSSTKDYVSVGGLKSK